MMSSALPTGRPSQGAESHLKSACGPEGEGYLGSFRPRRVESNFYFHVFRRSTRSPLA